MGGVILIWPFGRWYLVYGLYGTYYLIYMIFSFFGFGILLRLSGSAGDTWKERKKERGRHILWWVLGVLCGFLSGLNGIKQMLLFYAPLAIALFFQVLSETSRKDREANKKKQDGSPEFHLLWCHVVFCVANLAGYLINEKVLQKRYPVRSLSGLSWKKDSSVRLYDVWLGFLTLFGYEGDCVVTSAAGIASLIGLAFGIFVVISLFFLFGRRHDLAGPERLILGYVLSALGFCGIVFCMLDYYKIYFWLPILPFAITALLLAFREAVGVAFRKTRVAVTAFSMVGLMMVSRNTVNAECNDPLFAYKGYPEAVEFLLENGLTQGYGSFWNVVVLRELSNGKIDTWSLYNTKELFLIYEWLQEKDKKEREPEGEVFFILNSNLEGSDYAESVYLKYGEYEEIYSRGDIHIYLFESAAAFQEAERRFQEGDY